MGRMNLEGMLESADFEQALRWHLSSNHFPPVPLEMLDPCRKAIELANAGEDVNTTIELPEGFGWKSMATAPVWAILEGYHLDGFLDIEDWNWGDSDDSD